MGDAVSLGVGAVTNGDTDVADGETAVSDGPVGLGIGTRTHRPGDARRPDDARRDEDRDGRVTARSAVPTHRSSLPQGRCVTASWQHGAGE